MRTPYLRICLCLTNWCLEKTQRVCRCPILIWCWKIYTELSKTENLKLDLLTNMIGTSMVHVKLKYNELRRYREQAYHWTKQMPLNALIMIWNNCKPEHMTNHWSHSKLSTRTKKHPIKLMHFSTTPPCWHLHQICNMWSNTIFKRFQFKQIE